MIGVAMMWIYFHRYEHYVAINSKLCRPQLAQWKRILGIGLPAGGEFQTQIAPGYSAFLYAYEGNAGIGAAGATRQLPHRAAARSSR